MSDEAEAEEAQEADDVAEDDEPEESTGLQAGDFIVLEYTARTVEDGMVIDTTDPEVAEEEGLDEEEREFEPRTLVLGEGFIFEPVEDDIVGGEVGQTGTVEIPAAEAFGEFDDEQVRTVSANKIDEDDRYPGAQITVDGEQGRVETIVGGRARVDFNHPLAGEDIEYEYEVVDVVEDRLEKAQGFFEMYLDMELEMWIETDTVEEEQLIQPDEDEEDEADEEAEAEDEEDEVAEAPEPETEVVEVEKETLYIEATPQLTMNQQWMFQKQQVCQQVIDLLDLDRVVVQEIIDGAGMGMGMGGMMGGMGAGAGGGDIEEALEDADVDADEIMEEIEGAAEGADE